MAHVPRLSHRRRLLLSLGQSACVAALTTSLLAVPAVAAEAPAAPVPSVTAKKSRPPALTPQQRALHLLNRLSFGPRPGEVAKVEQEGVEAWFQRQLHPDSIPDDALQLRLTPYPAMQLSQDALMSRFPTPAMLRRFSAGKLASPADPLTQAIYRDAARRYEEKAEAKQDAQRKSQDLALGAAPIVRIASGSHPGAADPNAATTEQDIASRNALLTEPANVRLQHLLAMSPEQMRTFQDGVRGPDRVRLVTGMTPEEIEVVAAMKSPERVVTAEVLSTRLIRGVYSQRQLQAVMTDFWLNHFNVFLHKNQDEPYLLPAYEREAILPRALGHFEDLLIATAQSPAMLAYLDNAQSIGPNSKAAGRAGLANASVPPIKKAGAAKGINENYARELMELHTVGVNGGYTQQDIIEVAKCFSGWTLARPEDGGAFLFNPNRHEPGPKTVLGHVIPEGGINEGLEVLHLLATNPSTAQFLSQKLAERFVSDTPPPALVHRMAATFLASQGDIAAVLTTMVHAPEFWSPQVYRAKVKTPLEFAVSALRATGSEVEDWPPLQQALDRMGMPVYGMQTPNGYSWQAPDWVSSNALLTRMNFALVLSANHLQGTQLSWPALLHSAAPGLDDGPDPMEQQLEEALLGQPASPQTRAATLAVASQPGLQQEAEQGFAGAAGQTVGKRARRDGARVVLPVAVQRDPTLASRNTDPELATLGGLLLGSPDFQRR